MENLLTQQYSLGKKIEQLVANYKTTAVERRTSKYLKQRLEKLESIWEDFYSNHVEIEAVKEDKDAQEITYWKNNYFNSINQLYENFKATLSDAINTLNPSSPNPALTGIKERQGTMYVPLSQSFNDDQVQLGTMIKRQESIVKTTIHYLEDIENKTTEKHPKSYYEIKKKILQDNWSEILKNNQLICTLATKEELESHAYRNEEIQQIDEWLQDTIIALQEKLHTISDQARETTNVASNPSIKLPVINMPTFSGDYLKWTQFKELYTQLIHNQPLSNIQKMCYLTSYLSGEAKAIIQHLANTDQNYVAAWDLLNKRYDNKRILVNSVLNRLMSQPSIQNESAAAIRTLHDTTNECLLSLKNLGIGIDTWDPILLNIIIKKLDKTTHSLYEQSLESSRDLQPIQSLLDFLELRFQTLEALGKEKRCSTINATDKRSNHSFRSALAVTAGMNNCVLCQGNHPLRLCKRFSTMPPTDRYQTVKRLQLCINCLKPGHLVTKCMSGNCLRCAKKHHTLLHMEPSDPPKTGVQNAANGTQTRKPSDGDTNRKKEATALTAAINSSYGNQVLLSTVVLQVADKNGQFRNCRAILDCGSEINIITKQFVNRLGLKRIDTSVFIQGIGHTTQSSQQKVNVTLRSRKRNFCIKMEAFTMPQITEPRPVCNIDTSTWALPKNLPLADPHFNQTSSIDMLIGAELYYQLLCVGQISLGTDMPTLQNTVFGWIVSGKVKNSQGTTVACGICTAEERKLDEQIEHFWKLEECEPQSTKLSSQEINCETHFKQTTTRNADGRFVVHLPFLEDTKNLGESRHIAMRRFLHLERKLAKNSELQDEYGKFMQEYENLEHMEEIKLEQISGSHYFLPHHCVLKPESTTTKLRVVFDASCKTTNNKSLNDILCKGPTIQDDLFAILLRFRMPRFVFTADIEKMYRQVLVAERDRKYQLIIWRNNPQEAIKYYQLRTVTYGTASAPYLATKCLQQLAMQNEVQYPLGSSQLRENFYMDDAMCGANNLREAIEMQTQLRRILQSAGFSLRKWCSNHPKVLQDIPDKDLALQLDVPDRDEGHIKTLGLTWIPKTDEFLIKTNNTEHGKVTKRTALSDIAHLFDPLGLMGPVTIIAKIFIQDLWKRKLDWDAALPMEMHTTWKMYLEGLQKLNTIKIPRHVCSGRVPKDTELHVFADASERAYGAAIYVRAVHTDGTITVHLLCSKSRVAPLKTVTLPRLELCAAKLGTDLLHRVKADLHKGDQACFFWTDSEIVLCWINSEPFLYNTFVANRIASIQGKSSPQQWRHVSSRDNPADLVSRGVAPDKLKNCNLWFYGPMFLHGRKELWPLKFTKKQIELEKKKPKNVLLASHKIAHFIHNIDHHNSYEHLQRVTAYVTRFVNNCRTKDKAKRLCEQLTVSELENAQLLLIKEAQAQGFEEDLKELTHKRPINHGSPLSSLAPFLDDNGIIRVGGRLEAASLAYDAKHPMLLPYTHYVTKLIMIYLHKVNLHPGPQTLLAIARQRFWPVKGKTIARSVVQNCVRCARLKPKLLTQQMGQLPQQRIQAARPFSNAGVDFCGPFYVHFKIRGKRPLKAYVAVFCCFATKAVHLEVVSDLTTEAFVGALKRFTGRRGHCRTLWCDNATNFVGAKNQLTELKDIIYAPQAQQKITKMCTRKGMDFRFIPPRAPHFGGLWEAAVKSAKYFLQRHAANSSLTYEELETAVIEVEAILNSRPITPLSDDPNDLCALTPGHFLIGEPLTSALDAQTTQSKGTLGQRWKIISEIKENFWKRWTSEYLCQLQQRSKWKHPCQNIQPGMMVVIKDDNVPVMKWQLGRILEGIKGTDGLIRVADVKTATGILRRPIHNLAPLPIEIEETDPSLLITNEEFITPRAEKHKLQTNVDTEESRNQDHEPKPQYKRTCYSMSTMATILLFIGLILPIFGQPQVNLRPFQSPPGLYFERMGDADLILNEWHLVVYYNMSTYWKEFNTIKNGVAQLSDMCTRIKVNLSCSSTVNQFTHRIQELHNNNEFLLQSGTKSHLSRKKRGALNVVGNVANALFGVLDAEYAKHMSVVIHNLKQNDAKLLELIKNQTSLIDVTTNLMKSERETIDHQLQEFERFANQSAEEIKGLHKLMFEQQIAQVFNFLALRIILILDNYQRVQTALLDVIIDMHHGKINPQLISPIQLKGEIQRIKEQLPSSLRLPGGSNDIMEFYSLMTIEGRCLSNQMIFRLKLPLFTYERFELLHIVPVPMKIKENISIIIPDSTYLIISLHRDQYYPLSEQELATC